LYDAYQEISVVASQDSAIEKSYDVVGPVCESADFFGKERKLALTVGDLLAINTAGAYGFSMSSNYNSRPRAAEVLVDGSKMHLIRRRETFADLIEPENLISW
jgi:diaminopimelate decarboxylase